MTYASKVKAARKKQRLTNKELAAHLKVTEQTIYNRLRLDNWTLSEARTLNKLLDIDAN